MGLRISWIRFIWLSTFFGLIKCLWLSSIVPLYLILVCFDWVDRGWRHWVIVNRSMHCTVCVSKILWKTTLVLWRMMTHWRLAKRTGFKVGLSQVQSSILARRLVVVILSLCCRCRIPISIALLLHLRFQLLRCLILCDAKSCCLERWISIWWCEFVNGSDWLISFKRCICFIQEGLRRFSAGNWLQWHTVSYIEGWSCEVGALSWTRRRQGSPVDWALVIKVIASLVVSLCLAIELLLPNAGLRLLTGHHDLPRLDRRTLNLLISRILRWRHNHLSWLKTLQNHWHVLL